MLQFLRNLFDPLFDLMGFTLTTFHGWGAPWWLSIVMLTIIVRTLLFPLTIRQVKSMRKVQELRPEMDKIRAEHKDDPRKQQEEMMKLYGERRVNPLGGCLPIFVQIPIFIVLFYTIKEFEALESFRTGGLFWFQDLTVRDPLFILPVLYIVTMMIAQEIAMKNTAPEQRRIMRFLPVVFGVFLITFPAGLFVYWVASNIITIGQNLFIYRDTFGPGDDDNTQKAPATTEEAGDSTKVDDGYRAKHGPAPTQPEESANGDGAGRGKTGKRNRAKKR